MISDHLVAQVSGLKFKEDYTKIKFLKKGILGNIKLLQFMEQTLSLAIAPYIIKMRMTFLIRTKRYIAKIFFDSYQNADKF